MGYWLYSFDGLTLPTGLGESGSHDIGGGSSTSHPGRAGAGIVHHPLVALAGGGVLDALGSGKAPRVSMDLRAEVMIVPPSGLGSDIEAKLNQWLAKQGTRGVLTRLGDDGSQHTATARLVQVDAPRRAEHLHFLPMKLLFTLTGLPWAGSAESLVTTDLGNNPNDLPSTGASTANPFIVQVVNNGNVNQAAVKFTLTAGTGNVTAFSVTNPATGASWTWAGTLVAGQVLVVDCGARSVINNGADDYAHFTPPTATEDWLALVPGENDLSVSLTQAGGLSALTITYADAWG